MAQHPLREGLCGQLMLALYGSGRQSEALEVFRELRDRLDRELGLVPGRRLHELQRAILNGEPALPRATHELPRPSRRDDATCAVLHFSSACRSRHDASPLLAVAAAGALAAIWLGFDRGSGSANAVTANSALVVDRSGHIGTELDVGAAPAHAVWSGAFLWTSNERDGTVSRVDSANRTVDSIPVGRSPEGLAYADGQLWVANGGDGTVSAIDPTASKVVRTVRVGNGPTRPGGARQPHLGGEQRRRDALDDRHALRLGRAHDLGRAGAHVGRGYERRGVGRARGIERGGRARS